MRAKLLLLLAFALLIPAAPSASADEKYDTIADAIQGYLADETDGERNFSTLMERLPVTVDPWLVAFTLVGRSDMEAASAYAERVSGVEGDKLRASVRAATPTMAKDARDILDAYLSGRASVETIKQLDSANAHAHAFLDAARTVFKGYALAHLQRWDEAERALKTGATLAKTVGWFRGTVGALTSAARCARRLGKMRANLHHLTRLHEEYVRARWDRDATRTLGFVANAHADVGHFAGAIEKMEAALAQFEHLGGANHAVALANFGVILNRAGNYARALTVLEEAEALEDDKLRTASIIREMAAARSRLAHHAEAKRLIGVALRLATEEAKKQTPVGRRHLTTMARAQGDRGSIYARAGELDEAEAAALEAEKLYKALDDPGGAALVKVLRSSILREANEPAAALRAAVEARDVLEDLENPYGVASALDEISQNQLAVGALDEADATIDEVLKLAVSPLLRAQALSRRARIELARGRDKAAEKPALQAVELLARAFVGVGNLYGAIAREEQATIYETAMVVCTRLSNTEQALRVLERARAGAFFESLDGRDRLRNATVDRTIRELLDKAAFDEAMARAALQEARAEGRLASIRRAREELEQRKAEFETLVERAQRSAKVAAGLLYPPKTATLRSLQSQLAPGDVMLLYAFFGERAFLLPLRRKDDATTALTVLWEKTSYIRTLCEAFNVRDANHDPELVAELRKVLAIDVHEKTKGTKRLIVSVNGPLTGMPFSLLTDREVCYVPSATTYDFLARNRTPAGSQVLALGDPVYATSDTVDEFVPSKYRGTQRDSLFAPLPRSREEADKVGDVKLFGKDATEENLRKKLKQQWRAVHLACHGVMDRERPMYSALALTTQEIESGYDGFLTSHEIFQLDLQTDLVVLSACETALGRVYKGEGLHGLPRAFMYAGAPQVLVSLWKVDDAATSVLMIRFHSLWNPRDKTAKRMSTTAALKAAQQYVREFEIEVEEEGGKKKTKPWAHPKYWAAWQLWGLPD